MQNQNIDNVQAGKVSTSNDETSMISLLKIILNNQINQAASALPQPIVPQCPITYVEPARLHCQMHSICQHRMQNIPLKNVPTGTTETNSEPSITGLLKTILENQTNQAAVSPLSSNHLLTAHGQPTVLYSNNCQCHTQYRRAKNIQMDTPTAATNDEPSIMSLLQTLLENQTKQAAKLDDVIKMQETILEILEARAQPTQTLEVPNRPQFKKLDSVEDCHDFEDRLKSSEFVQEMIKHFQPVCGAQSQLYGDNVAYSLIDHVFSRRLFTLVTWSGVSRGTESKECFQKFDRIFQFFFDLVRKVDSEYSIKSLKDFFQKVISNSKRRFEQKRLRISRVKLSSRVIAKRLRMYSADKERSYRRRNSNVEAEVENDNISDEATDNDEDFKDNISVYSTECNIDEVIKLQTPGIVKSEETRQ